MLNAPIAPLLIRMALPNILIMLAQASTGLVETFWVSRLGTDALAGMALVFPANVVFIGNGFVWVMNGLASVIRGTGNMRYPAIVTCAGVLFLIPVSPLLIFGVGPVPGLALPEGALRSSPIMLRAPSQWPGTSWPVARRCAFTGPISAGDSSPAFCGLGLFPRSIPS